MATSNMKSVVGRNSEPRPVDGKGDAPSHEAFIVRESGDGKSRWWKMGAAWPHKDGKGFSVDLVPYGRIELRVPRAPGEEPTDGYAREDGAGD